MIKSLYIKNFTLIEELSVDFSSNFNIIIGETGSGKSIMIDALMVMLGNRADTDLIRSGETKSIIEGVFDINDDFKEFFIDNEIDFSNELILRREINLKGNTRNFINDSPVNASLLKQLGSYLVDFHGQHDNRILLNKNNHLKLVDSFANNYEVIKEYQLKYKELVQLNSDINSIIEQKEYNQELYKSHSNELKEIEEIKPKINEIEEINDELVLLENSEVIFNFTNSFIEIADNENDLLVSKLKEMQKINTALANIDKQFESFTHEINQSIITIKEMNSFYRNYNLDINFNELRAEELRNRLNQLKYLEKRYGSLENALNRKDELESKVGLVENYDYEIQKKKELLVKIKQDAFKLAEKLNLSRRSITSKLCENIVSSLNEMGMENTNFEISFSKTKGEHSHLKDDNGNYLTSNGIDLIEFLISTNKGESLKPLTEIASGGEISRVMLAVKSVLAEFDNIPTLIFDEIDTGISGRISQKVGFIMKKISSNRQLITITHLPQIAALGDNNILIKKIDNGDKTLIKANILNDVEKVLEIAKLLSGENLTEASISSAKELIKN